MSDRTEINILSNLDFQDAHEVALPQRSRLHHLQPMGVNTPDIESFTSYISRLAATHNISVLSLVKSEILPLLPRNSNESRNFQSVIYGPYARALNGLEKMAKHWRVTLEALTLREDLILLSMSRWCEVFTPIGVIRSERAWCPECYEQWRAEGAKLFEPLIWFIKPVLVCIHHKNPLVTRCPHCSKSLPVLSSHYRVGYCSKCMKWLGGPNSSADFMDNSYRNEEIEWQQWIAKNLGELLAIPTDVLPHGKGRIADVLRTLVNKAPRKSVCGFAEWLRVPEVSLRFWCTNRATPRLTALLYICRRLEVNLTDFLLKDNVASEINFSSAKAEIIYEKRLRTQRDEETIKKTLEATITSTEMPPPSVLSMASQLGIDAWSLRSMFPDLCKRISANLKKYREERKKMNIKSICEEVRRISLELHHGGVEPSRGRVNARMSKGAYFLSKEVQDALISIRAELGYKNI